MMLLRSGKQNFQERVGAERFDKEYAYGIRHNYGKEGKRTITAITLRLMFVVIHFCVCRGIVCFSFGRFRCWT
ncbi:hypothetical protein OROMI_004867 [Orobanche minor]